MGMLMNVEMDVGRWKEGRRGKGVNRETEEREPRISDERVVQEGKGRCHKTNMGRTA
jgi:hypothetical protein